MSKKRTPKRAVEKVIGKIDMETPIGTVFEFEMEAGGMDPRTNSKRKTAGEFRLRLTEKGSRNYLFTSAAAGSKHPISVPQSLWGERYAAAVTGVRWPVGKAVDNVKRSDGKPAAKASAMPGPAGAKARVSPQLAVIPVASIVREVHNHRGPIDKGKLAELAGSIVEMGLIHPVAVCRREDKFVLIAGHRRVAAHQQLQRKMIDVRIWEGLTNEQIAEMQFLENLQREDLTPIEEARGIHALIKAGQSIDTVASRIGRSTEFVRGRLDLLRLAKPIQSLVASGRLPLNHGRLIARVGDAAGQMKVAVAAMGSGSYYGTVSKTALAEAAKTDHVVRLEDVRQSVTLQLQALGGAHWPMDAGYAGKRACQGCIDNSATDPGLFEQIRLPGKSKKGNCSNKGCFAAKLKAWMKDPQKKRGDKERTAKAKDKPKAGAGAAATGGKDDDGLQPKRKAFPSTPEQRLAVALWEYGVSLADQVIGFMGKTKKLPADALAIAVRLGLSEVGVEIWVKQAERAQAICKAIRGKAAVTISRPVVVQIMEGSVVSGLRNAKPEWPSHRREPDNVPLGRDDLEAVEVLEALAKRWKIAVKQTRPTLADFQTADPAAVIATGKKLQALAAIAECSDMALLERLNAKALRGDWRRSGVRQRIEALKRQATRASKKTVKAAADKK